MASAENHRHSVALALAGLACALAIAACGSSGSAGAGPQGSYSKALKFSQCMRAHGVTNFPDPSTGSGGGIQIGGPGSNIDPAAPSFQSAQRSCAKYAPFKGGPPRMTEAQRVAAFKFAKCVRSHGYPDFPDPSDSAPRAGGGPVAVLSLRGMVFAFSSTFNPRDPAFHAAAARCGLTLPKPGLRGPGIVKAK